MGSTAALVVIYYLLPLDHFSTWAAVTILVIGLAVLIALVAFQVRSIVVSPFPVLRALEALAISSSAPVQNQHVGERIRWTPVSRRRKVTPPD